MAERVLRGARDLWLPALVFVTGGLVTLALWGYLVAERRDAVLQETREVAAETSAAIGTLLEEQFATLGRVGEHWAHAPGRRHRPEWRAEAEILVRSLSGVTSLRWVDGSAAAEARRPAEEPGIHGPLRDETGAIAYRVELPVQAREGNRLAGVVEGEVRVGELLVPLLRGGRSRGYALTVVWNGQEIFAGGAPTADPWQDWWRAENPVSVPGGGSWKVVHRPTADLAASLLTPLPHYLLGAGLLLSLALAVLVHEWRLTLRQSRFLTAANRALEQSSGDLRRLNAILEQRVAARTEELQDAVNELEAFNYSVSHDLRSPLGAILNFAAILEEDYRDRPLDEGGLMMISRIRRSANRATALLEDLLDLSRAGRSELDQETLDMTELARDSFSQARAEEKDAAEVQFVLEPLPPARGDRALLGAVFVNLFSNALKYSRHRDKPHISVRGREEAGELVYEVADDGCGFDMRFADKLFGLFERLHREDEFEGAGVGLALVARIVKRHGGRVWAEGEVDHGARIFFSLPRIDGEAPW